MPTNPVETNTNIYNPANSDDQMIGGYDLVISRCEIDENNNINPVDTIILGQSITFNASRRPYIFPELGTHNKLLGVSTQTKSGRMDRALVKGGNILNAIYGTTIPHNTNLDDSEMRKGAIIRLSFHDPADDGNGETEIAKIDLKNFSVSSYGAQTREGDIGEVESVEFSWTNTVYYS